MMEHWNTGLNKNSWILLHYSIIPLFHYSRIILLNFFKFWPFWPIHLTFACLPCTSTVQGLHEAASAKAGILVFGIAFIEIVVCPFGQLIETVF
jgi:hypothetical protein